MRAEQLVAALALSLSLVAPAVAAESHDVLIVGTGSPELVRKLRAEAAYAGFNPIERASGDGAPATLRVLSRERVELSVEGVDREQRSEQMLLSRASERDSFALRVVEQMRARLVDVGWTLPAESPAEAISDAKARADGSAAAALSQASEGERLEPGLFSSSRIDDSSAPIDDADTSSDADRTSVAGRVWLDGGIASSWASGGLGAVPQAALGAQLDLGAAWHARASSFWPLRDAELEAAEGEARIAWTSFSAALVRSFPAPQPWLAQAGVGAGLIVLDARGEARDDFSGRRERLYAGAYFAEASFGRELSSWLRLRASAVGGITAPRPVLRFDEREVASLGRFVGSLMLGLDLTWPSSAEAP